MKNHLKKNFPLILSITLFVGFGLYHLTKFETIDEHFWKFDRIEKYYNGIKEKKLKKTRINDKPGVTVALISGLGLPFLEPLNNYEDTTHEKKYSITTDPRGKHQKEPYKFYKINLTEKINLALRLPILLFNGLVMLPLIYWLLKIIFDRRIASLGILFIGTNPILVGISQIINPDALLWSFSTGALFSFLALLKTNEKKYIIIGGLLTGFALLSKYTANLLFVFYFLVYIFYSLSDNFKDYSFKNLLRSYAKNMIALTAISFATLIIFMPAVLITPKHLLYATIYSPVMKPSVLFLSNTLNINHLLFLKDGNYRTVSLGLFSALVFIFIFVLLPPIIVSLFRKAPRFSKTLLFKIPTILLAMVFLTSVLNAHLNTPLFQLDNLKEVSRSDGNLSFPQLQNESHFTFQIKALLIESQNFVFSLPTLTIALLFFLFYLILSSKKYKFGWFVAFTITLPFVFFIGALMSNVFMNVRYSIMLYPLFMVLSAIGITTICDKLKFKSKQVSIFLLVILSGLYNLWSIKPFYFNFTNELLPKKYVVTDSWGYGAYEAAEYLNSLPNAKNITVWTDRQGLCQFFVGKCMYSREVYIDYVDIDYLLLTRRGVLIRKPIAVSNGKKDRTYFKKYYSPQSLNNPEWQLFIGDRPGNFIKLINCQ